MKCKTCPTRKHCWDYGDCDSCDYGVYITKLCRKIERLKKENARLKEKTERSGHWIGVEYDGYADGLPVYDVWQCSACGNEWRGEETPCFCPDCGAKMCEEEPRQ